MNGQLIFETTAKDDSFNEYHFLLEFYIFQKDGAYIAYCPSLDISTSAETFNDAISAFYEMFQLHIECCIDAGTLHDDLINHGWKVQKKSISPPSLTVLIKKPEMKHILNGRFSYEKVVAPARIIMPA